MMRQILNSFFFVNWGYGMERTCLITFARNKCAFPQSLLLNITSCSDQLGDFTFNGDRLDD
jgi:hypothetical protein